ncbi:MAG: YihY/virulence factor BrkB family protein [Gemmatimonadota bacterium]|nr:YihY/virulence factor BrkB family protein [Gemmatimonadota bacterium]MDQ3606398.1 YihY/virulence factor BrkB family protein [Gemmatimonadota bacterium]
MPALNVVGRLKDAGSFVWEMISDFMADSCPQMAAALSYYTIFSLPPLLILLIIMIEPFLDPETVTRVIQEQAGGLVGAEGAAQVETVLQNVSRPGAGGALAATIGIIAFLFGATAAFAQLQAALNAAWEVGPDPTRGDIKNFLLKRVLSFTMILAIGFMLLVSLVLSAAIAALSTYIGMLGPAWVSGALLQGINTAISLTVITALFAAMFKFLPDAVVAWRDAIVGGIFTGLLFNFGKFLIGLYLGSSDPGSVYGAAGSLAIILLWIYYSSMILLLGAEFTRVWAKRRGFPIMPEPGAVRIIQTQERIEPGKKKAKREKQRQTEPDAAAQSAELGER